mgnify:CR=1 FL=1
MTEPGNYYVNVYDTKGFITQLRYSVTESTGTIGTNPSTTEIPSTSLPQTAGMSVPLAGMIAGIGVAAALVSWKRR